MFGIALKLQLHALHVTCLNFSSILSVAEMHI